MPAPRQPDSKIDWRDLFLAGLAVLVEALSLLFGVSVLTLASAALFWFALRGYRKERRVRRSWKFDVVSAPVLVVITMVLPIGISEYRQRSQKKTQVTESPIVSSQPIEAQMYSGDILTFPQPNHKCMGYHIFLDTPTDHNGKSTSVASLHLVVRFPELVRDYRAYSFVVAGFDHTGPVESVVVYTKAAGCHFSLEPTTLSANIHSSFIVQSNEFSVVASPFEGFLEAEFLTDPSTPEPKASEFHTLVSAPEKIEASGQYQQKPTDPLTDITFAFKDKRDLWWGVPKAPEAQH